MRAQFCVVTLVFLMAWPNPLCAEPSARKPNVLMIFSDDHGWADTGYYGRKDVRTPNLDRLAASGIRFDNGYVTAPQCIPSRTGLALGRYQQRFGLECNPDADKEQEFELPPGVTTIGDEMRRAGYRTGMAGKWHLGDKDGTQPYERGFDWCAYLRGGMGYHFLGRRPEELRKLVVPENCSPPMYQQYDNQTGYLNYRNAKNEIIPVGGVGYIPQLITDQVLDFIGQAGERPFFAYISYHPPHWPNEALPETIASYAHIEEPHRRLACAMITDVDTQIGRLLDFLEKKNIARDTLVVFFSDNGAPAHTSKGGTLRVGENASTNGPLKGFKGNLWEGGIRVPFLMSWPGRFTAGSVVGWPVSTLDLTPTFLAAAGAKPMKEADGVNLMPHLDGKISAEGPDRALFWRYHTAWCADSAVRRGPWKLVRQFSQKQASAGEPPTTELYHIPRDQAEADNLAAAHPDIVASLKKELEEWEKTLAEPKWATVLKPPVLEK
jgi:arylsulfatase A-like enzyme